MIRNIAVRNLKLVAIAIGNFASCAYAATIQTDILSSPSQQDTPRAVFSAAYQAEYRGKTLIHVPPVYELVTIALALTPSADKHPLLVKKGIPYHDEVMRHFAPVKDHPFVLALEQELQSNILSYFDFKMDAYSLILSDGDTVVPSPIYARTGFEYRTENALVKYLPLLQEFAKKADFSEFYDRHQPLYESQTSYYRNDIDIPAMLNWLRANFPDTDYDSVHLILSPLTFSGQSATWFEENGFSELHAHVNYPYPSEADQKFSPAANRLRHGSVAFTEINHGFINPTADKYAEEISVIFSDLDFWRNPATAGAYSAPQTVFNEMMNWALVNLYYWDKAPVSEKDQLIARIEENWKRVGFHYFPEFSQFLLDIYRDRQPGTSIADFYPRIISWFRDRKREMTSEN